MTEEQQPLLPGCMLPCCNQHLVARHRHWCHLRSAISSFGAVLPSAISSVGAVLPDLRKLDIVPPADGGIHVGPAHQLLPAVSRDAQGEDCGHAALIL